MSDYSELERLAEEATAGPWSMCGEADGSEGFEIIQDIWNEHGTHVGKDVVVYEWSDESDPLGVINRKDAEFIAAANPAAVLALITENEQNEMHLRVFGSVAEKAVAERDQLRAEVAGLRTGYEAYERVNAELNADNEALRQSVADHKACIASDNELFREVNLECNRYHSVIVAVGELLGISKEEQDEEEASQEELVEAINELWGQVHGMQEDLDDYKSEHEVLHQALAECADSLHGEMLQKFGGQLPDDMHPVTRREYHRDMAEVARYRAALGQGEQS